MPSLPEWSLRELQQQFVREVLYRDSAGLPSRIQAHGLTPERRLAIYRTNARENFALALEAAFPLLLLCMGSEEFRQLTWAYQRACPSPAGNLFHVGERLPGFLAAHVRGTGDEHLIDVARLEWAIQEALVAADGATALDLVALAAVPAERQADIRFQLHPSVRLLRTERSVFALWQARQTAQPLPEPGHTPEALLVQRRAAGVHLHRLPAADSAWLEAIRRGATLADAASAVPDTARDSLGDLLVRWAGAGVVTAFA